MIIELWRALAPEEMGERTCAICTRRYRAKSVLLITRQLYDDEGETGTACLACLSYLNSANPGRFPSVEEYRGALSRYPRPVWASVEEIEELECEERYDELFGGYEASKILA